MKIKTLMEKINKTALKHRDSMYAKAVSNLKKIQNIHGFSKTAGLKKKRSPPQGFD